MRLHARNTVLEQENEEQKTVLQNRKRYLSEKRRAIEGKHFMTAEELRKVRESEEMTKQRKAPKKGTRKRTTRSKAQKESSDESEYNSDVVDDEVFMYECIEVEI